jgi:hypothetical protein
MSGGFPKQQYEPDSRRRTESVLLTIYWCFKALITWKVSSNAAHSAVCQAIVQSAGFKRWYTNLGVKQWYTVLGVKERVHSDGCQTLRN